MNVAWYNVPAFDCGFCCRCLELLLRYINLCKGSVHGCCCCSFFLVKLHQSHTKKSLGVKQQLLYMSEHVVCIQFEKKKRKILVGQIVKVQRCEHLCVTFSYEFFAGCWPHEHGVCRLAEVNLIMISYNRSRRGRQGSDLQRLRQVPLWLRPARSSFAKKGRGTEEIHTTMNIIAADITNCMSDSRRWELQLWGQIDAVLLLHSGCY